MLRPVSVAILAVAVLATGDALAAPYSLKVAVTGEPPARVVFDRDGDTQPLAFDGSANLYSATVDDAGLAPVVPAAVVAEYDGDWRSALPIRLIRKDHQLSLTFHRTANLSCTGPVVQRLEQQSYDFPTALIAYFDARELALRTGAGRCGTLLRKRVVKAWFDRSYYLATHNDHIRLDPEAQAEYATLDPTYSTNYVRQAAADELRTINDAKLAAFNGADYTTATALSRTLLSKLDADPKLRQDALELQGLSVQQLSNDDALITTRASLAGAKFEESSPGAAATAAGPEVSQPAPPVTDSTH